jgi:hypothetical protein
LEKLLLKLKRFFVFSLIYSAPIFAQKQQNLLYINFSHKVGNKDLIIDTANYQNSFEQSFSISKCMYYVGDFTLSNDEESLIISNNYYLINEEKPLSKNILIPDIKAGTYNNISFNIGVDSVHNCSGLQTGDLDPAFGMFWAWNTGYVFLKLEGTASISPLPQHLLEYHIGGFRHENNAIRKIMIHLSEPLVVSTKPETVFLQADLLKLFSNNIDFSQLPSATDFRYSKRFADNYANMFSENPSPQK